MIGHLKDKFKNNFLYKNKYKTHLEAVVISCFFNPQKSSYRRKAFDIFYDSIKHLNHRIVECVIGDDEPELPLDNPNITRVHTKNLLWHKESLLNGIVKNLPAHFKYIFWVDADVIFTNNHWLVEAVEELHDHTIVQPFEYCVHLDQDQLEPDFDVHSQREYVDGPNRHKKMWRSFASNFALNRPQIHSEDYDVHGHVGFAWGARRSVLDNCPLYDKGLIGGGDHIIAHACIDQIPHLCITKSFTEDIDNVLEWSKKFHKVTRSRLGFVKGDLYHIWHGDLNKRNYYKRILEFTPKSKNIVDKDENGLYVTDNQDATDYMTNYFIIREVTDVIDPTSHHHHGDDQHHKCDSDDNYYQEPNFS